MKDFTGKEILSPEQAIRACQHLIDRLADPNRLPLEREANYLLAQMLRMQVKELGLMDNPDVQDFLRTIHDSSRTIKVRRFPDDFL